MSLVKDPANPGYYLTDGEGITADPANPGYYLLDEGFLLEDPVNPGYFFADPFGSGVLSVSIIKNTSGNKGGVGRGVLSVEPFVGIHTEGIGFARLVLTGLLSTAGTKVSQGAGLLYVTDVPTIDGHKQQWYFTPPTRRAYSHGDRFWRRVHIDQGVTVIRKGEAFVSTETPSAEDFEEADKVYVGGYVYPIEDEERLALQAAGYDPFPED